MSGSMEHSVLRHTQVAILGFELHGLLLWVQPSSRDPSRVNRSHPHYGKPGCEADTPKFAIENVPSPLKP